MMRFDPLVCIYHRSIDCCVHVWKLLDRQLNKGCPVSLVTLHELSLGAAACGHEHHSTGSCPILWGHPQELGPPGGV